MFQHKNFCHGVNGHVVQWHVVAVEWVGLKWPATALTPAITALVVHCILAAPQITMKTALIIRGNGGQYRRHWLRPKAAMNIDVVSTRKIESMYNRCIKRFLWNTLRNISPKQNISLFPNDKWKFLFSNNIWTMEQLVNLFGSMCGIRERFSTMW